MTRPNPNRPVRWTRVPRRLLAVLLGGVLFASTACSTIPDESLPQPVGNADSAARTEPDPVDQPKEDLPARDIVRGFVEASGAPNNNHAAARVYLSERAGSEWRAGSGPVIIEDTFSTVPAVDEDQPSDPNEQIIMLRGTNVGKLGADGAFTPRVGSYEEPVTLRRQQDGQWRMVDPPEETVTTLSKFNSNYFNIRLYFYDPDINVLVPDLRYVISEPTVDRPRRVIDLLLDGPSNAMNGAVRSMLPDGATTSTTVTDSQDGALVVPLSGLGELPEETKRLLAAQVVLTLQPVTPSRIRLLSDGAPLVEGKQDWRPGDVQVPSSAAPAADLPGLALVDRQLTSLSTGEVVPGPAGEGAYPMTSAAQSADGNRLAIVERVGNGARLRIGPLEGQLSMVDLRARSMTRPTWRPTLGSGEASTEVWTVVDGKQVVRAREQPNGVWGTSLVNATDLNAFGPITELRLSPDGTRVAAVAGGKLVVAGVDRDDQGAVNLGSPRQLQPEKLSHVVGADWLRQDTLVAATSLNSMPVVKLPVDGLRLDTFDSSNLTPPMRGITAAPGRPVVAVDAGGMSMASDTGEVWRPHSYDMGAEAIPFYPG
ncbi:sporulation and spore germination protein [Tamaricihabitans halophyticus]|uniref:Sporulation and spore germination protein n=1 Tax=Tamaricihabitans halophyticus TaxID=1262583 RepID=A0A4R2QIN7_9PSEU|nr:LpqB family beta-propeller domain-containing protein [Tamaricihabitans halophyticus]TCP49222.1 sporulation and spore germination protein [Tamaricihabitans halophyticus]